MDRCRHDCLWSKDLEVTDDYVICERSHSYRGSDDVATYENYVSICKPGRGNASIICLLTINCLVNMTMVRDFY